MVDTYWKYIPLFRTVPKVPENVDLTGQVAIVTGGNIGIGSEISRHLYRLGAHVIIASRNEHKATIKIKEIQNDSKNGKYPVFYNGGKLEFVKLDLSSITSIKEFSKKFTNRSEKKLNILVNNAGLVVADGSVNEQGIPTSIQVNHFGHFLLTNLLMDSLKRAYNESSTPKTYSRVVFVSSSAHYFPGKFDLNDVECKGIKGPVSPGTLYGISKQMNIMCASELTKREKKNGIISIAPHPGAVNSEFADNIGGIVSYVLSLLKGVFCRSVIDGAACPLKAAIDPVIEASTDYHGSYMDCDGSLVEPSPQCLDSTACEELWMKSLEVTGLLQSK